ncbi:chitin deacetylase [Haplosporangium sp. Z 11]|nr:chitin deacetylase [Haplosporangium sp. Z 11]
MFDSDSNDKRNLHRIFKPSFIAIATTTALCLLPLVSAALNPAEFPPASAVPAIDSPQVKKWLSEIDLSGAPKISPNSGDPPDCPDVVETGVCYWTCEDCSADDVIECPDKNNWGITFDDGPTPATPPLLQFLDEKKVKATFFLVGSNVVKYPEMVAQEARAGHHLASHTWSHHALTTLSNEQIVAEIKWTEKAIEDATGYRVRYMRPPYGDVDNRVRFVLKQLGYTVVNWSGDTFDSNDWKIPETSKTKVISHFKSSLDMYTAAGVNNTKGFISLEHDLTADTVEVARALIEHGMQSNLNIMTVSDCLHDNAPYMSGNGAVSRGPVNPASGRAPSRDNNGRELVNTSGSDLPNSAGSSKLLQNSIQGSLRTLLWVSFISGMAIAVSV